MLSSRLMRHSPRRATFSLRVLMLPLLLMVHLSNDGAEGFLVPPPPPTLRAPALFLALPGHPGVGAARTTPGPSRGAAARRHRVPPLSMSTTTSSTTNGGGPHGSRPGDSITREGFLAGTTAIVVAGLAPGVLTKPRGPPSYDVKQERIFDTRKRSFVPAEPERLIVPGGVGFSQRIVCLGETHTHPLHHRMQFNVIKAIHGVTVPRGEPLAIGLEMFYRQQQGPLDRYVFNHGDLQTLKRETKWDQTWGFDFNQYAKIFHYAREQGIRLVGLNAPQSLLYLINRVGMAGLPKRIKDVLPEMDLGQEAHRRRFEETINGFQHGAGMDSAAMGRMYEAQTLWDEYMAETTSQYIKKAGGRMVLLAGNGHVQARDGIPDRVERRTGLKPFTVVPVSVGWTPEGLPDIEHPPGISFADWVYFTQHEIGQPQRGAGSNHSAGPKRSAGGQ